MFYHIVTSIVDKEEILTKYYEFAPDTIQMDVTIYHYTISSLLECPPLQIIADKILDEGYKYKELLVLQIQTIEDIKNLSREFQDKIFKNSVHINVSITEPFNEIYRQFLNENAT